LKLRASGFLGAAFWDVAASTDVPRTTGAASQSNRDDKRDMGFLLESETEGWKRKAAEGGKLIERCLPF